MLTVTRDVLRWLEITNIYILTADNRQHFAYLAEIGSNQFALKTPEDIILEKQERIKFFFKLRSYVEVPVVVLSSSIGYCTVFAIDPSDDATALLLRFTQLDSQNAIWSRRREERYDVQISDYKRLGLSSPQQVLLMDGLKMPFALKNISQHGLQLVTYATSSSRRVIQLVMQLDFTESIETITLTGNTIRQTIAVAKDSQRRFATISIQLIDPVPLNWRRRVVAYADLLAINSATKETN